MAQQRVEILNIETKTLKDLRNELKALKQQLEQMAIGSDEYNNTLQEITQKQKELASVTKSSVADMEGSYNALVKQLAELRAAWKATGDEAERNQIGEQMSEINSKLKELDASVGNYQRNVGNYESALDGLGEKLNQTGFNIDNAINKSEEWVGVTDNMEKTTIAMVGAFALVDQALALMGDESEETREILQKLQLVMAMSGGFKQIAEGAKGFLQLTKSINISKIALGGFKTALIGTGIGALVVAVGMLAANWEKVAKFIGLSTTNQNKFNEKQFNGEERLFGLDYRIAEAEGKTEEELIKIRRQYYKRMLEMAERESKRLENADKEQKEKSIELEKKYREELQKVNDDANVLEIKRRKERQDKALEDAKAFAEKRKSALEEAESLAPELTGLDAINAQYKKDLDKYKGYRDKKLLTQSEYNQVEKRLQERYNEELANLQLQQAEEAQVKLEEEQQGRLAMVDKLNKEYSLEATKAMDEYNSKMTDLNIAGENSEMRKLTETFIQSQIDALVKLKEAISVYGDEAKEAIAQIDSEISNLENQDKENKAGENDDRLNNVLELGDILISTADAVGSAWSNVFSSINDGIASVGDSINKGEKGWTKYGKVASAGLGVAANMLGTLADMQDTQTEEGFEKNKKLQIASATMSMLGGIVNTWQSVMSKENSWMTIWGQVAAGTTISAMMLATGLAQINQIKSTTFDGGGGAAVTPNVTAVSALQNPVQTVNEVQGASTEGEVKDQRVYVLESDIAEVTTKVNVTQSEARF